MKTLAALLIVTAVTATTAATSHAQYPFLPSPYPVMPIPVSPMPVPMPSPGFNPYPGPGGATIVLDSAFSPWRNTVMPGTMPIINSNGVHWLGADGQPHGQFRDANNNNNINYYSANPSASPQPAPTRYQAASSGWHSVGTR